MAERSTRSRGIAFVLLILGSLVGLLLAGQVWWRTSTTPALEFTGGESTGALAGVLAAAGLAGTGLALLLRVTGRRVLAVALGLLGLGMMATVVLATAPDPARFPDKVTVTLAADSTALIATWVPVGYAAAGALLVVGAVIMGLRAGSWPGSPDRYARTAARAQVRATDDAAEVWKAQDAGHDPTTDEK